MDVPLTISSIKQYGKPRNAGTGPKEKKAPSIIKIIPKYLEAGYFYDKGNFIVKVGSWYEPYEAELRELVEDAFNLPDDFVFEIGKHWELGHGWNEDQLDDFFGD